MSTRLEPVHVGAPTGGLSDWVIAPVYFNGFVGLTTTKGESVESPEFTCFGHKWSVHMFPGGDNDSDDRYVALHISNRTEEAIEVIVKVVVKHPNGVKDYRKVVAKSSTSFRPQVPLLSVTRVQLKCQETLRSDQS